MGCEVLLAVHSDGPLALGGAILPSCESQDVVVERRQSHFIALLIQASAIGVDVAFGLNLHQIGARAVGQSDVQGVSVHLLERGSERGVVGDVEGIGILARHLVAVGVDPCGEVIAEVLGDGERHGVAFVEQGGAGRDAQCGSLGVAQACVQSALLDVLGRSDERSLDDDVGESHLLGVAQRVEVEPQRAESVAGFGPGNVFGHLRHVGCAVVAVGVDCLLQAGGCSVGGYPCGIHLAAVGSVACGLKRNLRRREDESLLGHETKKDGIAVVGTAILLCGLKKSLLCDVAHAFVGERRAHLHVTGLEIGVGLVVGSERGGLPLLALVEGEGDADGLILQCLRLGLSADADVGEADGLAGGVGVVPRVDAHL